ncbi:Os05g0588550, partial [Oryza sativa Japonica Group]
GAEEDAEGANDERALVVGVGAEEHAGGDGGEEDELHGEDAEHPAPLGLGGVGEVDGEVGDLDEESGAVDGDDEDAVGVDEG